jgi:hypothetical protein
MPSQALTTGRESMAYNDLISSQVTLVAKDATIYSFAFDTPIAADSSPHLTQLGFQIDATMTAAITNQTGTIGKLITQLRVKVGSNTLIDWFSPVAYESGSSATTSVAQVSVLAQSIGGEDYFWGDPNGVTKTMLTGISFPVGLDASKSHRVNVTIGFDDVVDWYGGATGFSSGSLNVELAYGVSKEATLIGSSQQFDTSANAERTCTIHGKAGWNMLGVFVANTTETDGITDIRTNNGSFRALKPSQWRTLFGRTRRNTVRAMSTLVSDENTSPNELNMMAGSLFLDLRRLTAGAGIDLSIQTTAEQTVHFYPVYVAGISARTANAPSQTAVNVQSTTATVVTEDATQN